jgi:hypothetical protein
MLKLLFIIVPMLALLLGSWYFGSVRSLLLTLLLVLLAVIYSIFACNYYSVSLTAFVLLAHDQTGLGLALLLILMLSISALVQWLAVLRK